MMIITITLIIFKKKKFFLKNIINIIHQYKFIEGKIFIKFFTEYY